MTVVSVIGNYTDKCLEEIILSRLSNSYRITYIKNKSLVQNGQGYNIVVADSTELKSLYIPECIIIMKNGGIIPTIPLPEKSIIIVNSENTEQLLELKNSRLNVITCGSSEKDTLCYSSITSDSLVISLNREITAFSGRKILPLEIPFPDWSVKLDKMNKDVYYPIAFTALRLILDDFNSELGGLYS
ncbi:MAG: hypothetical protein FWG33_03385 [Oscillospiraceae bacterium]|nr:hypothetical protein [Oscillospiraceae bacterium]